MPKIAIKKFDLKQRHAHTARPGGPAAVRTDAPEQVMVRELGSQNSTF